MTLATDAAGNVLLAFDAGDPAVHPGAEPMPLALVAAVHAGRVVVVLNRERRGWELPGGLLDPGETVRQAALRELAEETGLVVEDLRPVGTARFGLARGHGERGALYRVDLGSDALAHEPDDEIEAVSWWHPTEALADLNPIDAWLAREALR